VRLSGLMQGPLPVIVFDDDVPRLGGPTNCNLRFGQNKIGPFTPASVQAAKSYLLTGDNEVMATAGTLSAVCRWTSTGRRTSSGSAPS
jgi:hypothetical protein